MSDVAQAGNLLLGRGKVLFDRFDAATGARTGYRMIGNCSTFEVTTTDEKRTKKSSAEAASPILKEVTVERTPEFSIVLNEHDKPNLGLILMGEEAEYTQAATPVVAEILSTAPVKDRHYKAAKRAIGSVTVKHGATTMVLNTDYKIVSAEAGLIYVINLPGSGNLTIDYTPAAITAGSGRDWVKAAKSTVIEGGILFLPDPAAGPKWEVEVWKVSISPDGALGLIQDDFGEFTLKGKVLTDSANHPNEPYYQAVRHP